MKLFFSPTSPYVRKVLVVALELGLDDQIQRLVTNPWDPETELTDYNPLGKVPALITDEDEVLFDSPVICEYLDSLHSGDKLIPPVGPARWHELRLQALADGVLDAAVLMRLEGLRPEEQQSKDWRSRQLNAIRRAVDVAESDSNLFDGAIKIGQISVACALAYLDFRLPEEDWRKGHPNLAHGYASWAARPAMQATMPPEA